MPTTTTWSLLPDPEAAGAALEREQSEVVVGVDWALDDNGDLIFPLRYTTGPEAVAQGIRIRVQTFLGEWFLDEDFGVPWYEEILGQKFSEPRVRAAFRDAIVAAPGVDELVRLTATYDSAARTLAVDWAVRTAFGVVTDGLER